MPFMPLVSEFHPLYLYETIILGLTNQFWDHFPQVTSIYEPQHDDASVCGPVLVSLLPTTTHAGFWATAR